MFGGQTRAITDRIIRKAVLTKALLQFFLIDVFLFRPYAKLILKMYSKFLSIL